MEQQTARGQEVYDYYAFISYASEDEKWASWLQNALEHYRLPTAIRKAHIRIPKRIFPVFRDETDLGGVILKKNLQKELKASQYLIVICSPNAVASDWVSQEIAYFASLGREDRVIPLVVDGEPFSDDPAKECFPQPLREMEEEHLGISVARHGKWEAFLRVVANLLNVRPDQMIQRDKRRRMIHRSVIAGVMLAVLVAAGIFAWWATPHSKYYRDYITRWEIPEGIYEVSDKEREALYCTYKITTRWGRVDRMECVNSQDIPVSPIGSPSLTTHPVNVYHYNGGKLGSIECRSETDRVIYIRELKYGSDENVIDVQYQAPTGSLDAFALAANTGDNLTDTSQSERSEITRQENTYDDNGLLIRVMYQRDNLREPDCDGSGVYGMSMAYNRMGQLLRVCKLDAQGNVKNDRYGCAIKEYIYDSQGRWLCGINYDAAGNRTTDEDKVCEVRNRYDLEGNPREASFYDEDGNPCNCLDGYSIARFSFDENGFFCAQEFFNDLGERCYDKETGVCIARVTPDELGCTQLVAYFDRNGDPVYNPVQMCAAYRNVRDEKGRVLEAWNLDTRGEVFYPAGARYAAFCQEYDDNGNSIRTYFKDAQGNLTMSSYGYAQYYDYYDDAGHNYRTEYRDENGDLRRSNLDIAVIVREYDSFGNWISTRYYDEQEQPCLYDGLFAYVEYGYENGNMVSTAYYGLQDQPITCYGYHRVEYAYDDKGNTIRTAYFGEDGAYCEIGDGYAVEESEYDEYGNLWQIRRYDAREELVMTQTFTYDRWGNTLQGVQQPRDTDGYSVFQIDQTFDERNQLIRVEYLDENGDPVEGETAIKEYIYDDMGNVIREDWLDGNGLPVPPNEDGYNAVAYAYDEAGNQVLRSHLLVKADGTEICVMQWEYRYDGRNNCVEKTLHTDADGDREEKTVVFRYSYNEYGDLIEESYFMGNGNKANNGTYHRVVYEYDDLGNLLAEIYYDADGNEVSRDTYTP